MTITQNRLKRILGLSIPIILAQASQNIVNLVDTAMVGQLGDSALAAVGLGGFSVFMFQSLLLGVSTGVQAMSARRKGEGALDQTAYPLNAGLLISLIGGIIITAIFYPLIESIYPYLNDDPNVQIVGVPYLEIRLLGAMFVAMNFSFRGFWNAIDLSKVYMGTLFFIHTLNIVLNYLLIFGNFGFPELGVEGAAIGTTVSYAVGTLIYFIIAIRIARCHGFLEHLPRKENIKDLLKLSLPNSIQQLFFSAGFTVLYWIIGQIGTKELASANVLINNMLIAILPGLGFGMAAATLVGQALGRKEPEDAYRWGWDVVKVCFVTVLLLTIPFWLLPQQVLGIYIQDPETLALSINPLRLMGLFVAFDSAGLTFMMALQGAGDTKRVMMTSIVLQWLIFIPVAYFIGPNLGFGLIGVWTCFAIYRLIQTGFFTGLWFGRGWVGIKV